MKPVAMLISLFFFAQLGGCAYAHTSGCRSLENRRDCSKEEKEAKEQNDRPTARSHVAPSSTGRAQPMPPMIIKREQTVPQAPALAKPTAPLPIGSCDAGGCWDNNANRYNGAAGSTFLDNSGRPCHRVGSWMQCF